MEIEINNNILLEELYDNKTWIHGTSDENIKITIFLITIEGYQLRYALKAINLLKTNLPVIVNVIMNISPTSKAYDTMRLRCKTEFFVQLDEDMELYENAIEIFYQTILVNNKKYCHTYYLIDEYLGIGEKKYINGIKLYNYSIMKDFPTSKNTDISTSSVDRNWHKSIEQFGFTYKVVPFPVGFHALHRKPFDLMLRFCKSTQSFLNNDIKKNTGDICRFIKPINHLDNFHIYFDSIIQHFINYKPVFKHSTFNKNYPIMKNIANRHIAHSILKEYDLSNEITKFLDSYYIDNQFNAESFHFLFTCNICNIFDIFSIIGIINTLYENYQYSFDKYPYDIYDYFLKIFEFRLCINTGKKVELDYFKKLFEAFDCVKITNDKNEQYIDCVVECVDIEQLQFIVDNNCVKCKDIQELKHLIMNRNRKNKLSHLQHY